MINWYRTYKDEGCATAIFAFIGIVALMAILYLLQSAIALWLWNIIVIPVFGAPALTYWQMYGLMWLARLIIPHSSTSTSED